MIHPRAVYHQDESSVSERAVGVIMRVCAGVGEVPKECKQERGETRQDEPVRDWQWKMGMVTQVRDKQGK